MASREKANRLDVISREMLRILSLYEQLSLLELWFEIGEAGALKPMTKEQVSSRLESLMAQGFLERIPFGDGDIRWALKRSSKRGDLQGIQIFREAGDYQSK
jgi:hypothetical protein